MTARVKYPRTFHCPWSLAVQSDDRMHASMDMFHGKRVVVTEKMDGENTSIYSDYTHARSIIGRPHVSRDWVKGFASTWQSDLPAGWRVCGENVYAQHSIAYEELETYFLGFSVWNDKNECLSWDDTVEWFDLLGIKSVPVLYSGIYNEELIKGISLDFSKQEGYVIRLSDSFHYDDFRNSVAKFVRKGHVQEDGEHWMSKEVVPNKLK